MRVKRTRTSLLAITSLVIAGLGLLVLLFLIQRAPALHEPGDPAAYGGPFADLRLEVTGAERQGTTMIVTATLHNTSVRMVRDYADFPLCLTDGFFRNLAVDPEAQRALDAADGYDAVAARAVGPGQSIRRRYAFDVPADWERPRVSVNTVSPRGRLADLALGKHRWELP